MAELKSNDVEIYTFPVDDETVSEVNTEMNEMMPFAVVGSREVSGTYQHTVLHSNTSCYLETPRVT